MHTTFHVPFFYDGDRGAAGYAELDIDLEVLPTRGMALKHEAWKTPREVLSVTLNLQDRSALVELPAEEVPDEQARELCAWRYRSHGWTLSEGLVEAADKHEAEHVSKGSRFV